MTGISKLAKLKSGQCWSTSYQQCFYTPFFAWLLGFSSLTPFQVHLPGSGSLAVLTGAWWLLVAGLSPSSLWPLFSHASFSLEFKFYLQHTLTWWTSQQQQTLLLKIVASSRLGTVTRTQPGFARCSLRIFHVLCTKTENKIKILIWPLQGMSFLHFVISNMG